MNKKIIGLIIAAIILGGAVWYFQDTRNMKDVAKEQEESIEQQAEETFSDDNDLFGDDVDFGDVEDAPLALDTTKAMK